ncbi:MAG: hypothetical protein ACO1RT_10230 [Planctomycetaceae bacterium]
MAPRTTKPKPGTGSESEAAQIARLERQLAELQEVKDQESEAELAALLKRQTTTLELGRLEDVRRPFPWHALFGFMLFVMCGFTIWMALRPQVAPQPLPAPVPVVVPGVGLSAYTAPIKAKLATDRTKAAMVADAYLGLRDALAGPSGQRVTDSRVYESVSRAFLTDLDTRAGVQVGAEIDAAIASYLGMGKSIDPKDPGYDVTPIDHAKRAKLIEIVGAIAAAAESVR